MPAPFELSIALSNYAAEAPPSWQHLIDAAVAADAAGVDRVVLSDHVVFGEHLETYADPAAGGTTGGRQPTGPDGHWLEPVTTIAYLAALTTRVRFNTWILLAALRRPVVLAKVLTTIDVLSAGRMELGVGVGWQREEYDAAGLSFEGRGRLLDETLEICQTLWRDEVASHHGPTTSFDRIHMMPKPVHAGGIPVWVSGTVQDNAMRRLARYGTGWLPWGADMRDPLDAIKRMRAAVARFDRDPDEIGVVWAVPHDAPDRIAAVVDAGVTDVRLRGVPLHGSRAEMTEQLSGIVTAIRKAAS